LGANVEALGAGFQRPRTPNAAKPTPQAATCGGSDTSDIFSLFICSTNQRRLVGRADGWREYPSVANNRRTNIPTAQFTYVGIVADKNRRTNVATNRCWAVGQNRPTYSDRNVRGLVMTEGQMFDVTDKPMYND